MWFFFIGVMGTYAAMHAYVFFKVRAAFPLPPPLLGLLALFLGLMVVSHVLTHSVERSGHVLAARIFGTFSNLWVAWIFWSFSAALAADLWNLTARAAGAFAPAARALALSPRAILAFAAACVVLGTAWGLVEASRLRVRELRIETACLPPGAPPIRIVHLTDVHLGIDRGPRLLRRIIARIDKIHPDVVVSTGDLMDSSFFHLEPLAAQLRAVQPPLGKFAVLGNHEYYAKLAEALPFHEAAGFQLLRGTNVIVAPGLRLAGVDDAAGEYTHQPSFSNESSLPPRDAHTFTILLKHQPIVLPDSAAKFDLQLSGHTHGGQIFPFQWLLRLMYRYGAGPHDLKGGSQLFVSRGAGTWGPPFRVLAPPEILLITLVPAS